MSLLYMQGMGYSPSVGRLVGLSVSVSVCIISNFTSYASFGARVFSLFQEKLADIGSVG